MDWKGPFYNESILITRLSEITLARYPPPLLTRQTAIRGVSEMFHIQGNISHLPNSNVSGFRPIVVTSPSYSTLFYSVLPAEYMDSASTVFFPVLYNSSHVSEPSVSLRTIASPHTASTLYSRNLATSKYRSQKNYTYSRGNIYFSFSCSHSCFATDSNGNIYRYLKRSHVSHCCRTVSVKR
jgi:hypothetical protein